MKFPLIDAYLICPNKENGEIAICTNQIAPGVVLNEIPVMSRKNICAMGSLIVNRGGAEKMIINSLVHKKLRYLILFGEETASFRPSSNLLLALMNNYKEGSGNHIKGSIGLGAQYPSISEKLLNSFRETVIVLPIFNGSKKVIDQYLGWVKNRVPKEIFDYLKSTNQQKKIYYDSLLGLIEFLSNTLIPDKKIIGMGIEEFQNLQPKIIILKNIDDVEEVNFEVRKNRGKILIDIDFGENLYSIEGRESFVLAYSLMSFINQNKLEIPIKQQLLLGAEISRVEMEIKYNFSLKSIIKSKCRRGERKKIALLDQMVLKEDKKYYYIISLKQGYIRVQVVSYSNCKCLFEFRSESVMALVDKLSKENRFQDYDQQILHRIDTGIEIARAGIALGNSKIFIQDFHFLPELNKTDFPLFVISGDSFLTNHKKIVASTYAGGVTQRHPDAHKGPMRSGAVLCVFRNPGQAFKKMPKIYIYGDNSGVQMREEYKNQLLSPKSSDFYTYGNRTRNYFGKDQLKAAVDALRANPNSPFVIQRFDYLKDMTIQGQGRDMKATHDPCLTHDIYFISDGKFCVFHIARAHNIINAYPQNLFGLYDAYDSFVAKELNLELGDVFMLSSRANILLLTEEQGAKTIMREPSEPWSGQDISTAAHNIRHCFPNQGVAYVEGALKKQDEKPNHLCIAVLEDYEGINIINKATGYLKLKGADHNNPIIGAYNLKKGLLKEENRLVYFQANARAGKIQATAVFLNGTKKSFRNDIKLCNYLATQYGKALGIDLGKLFFFYVPVKNN